MPTDKLINTVFNHGVIHHINYDGMSVVIFNAVADNPDIEVVGCYQDKKRIIKRIKRDSEIWAVINHFRKVEHGDIPKRGEGGLQRIKINSEKYMGFA